MKGASNLNDVKDCLRNNQVLALIIFNCYKFAYVVFIFMHAWFHLAHRTLLQTTKEGRDQN